MLGIPLIIKGYTDSNLEIPEMCCYIVAPLTKLKCDNFMHRDNRLSSGRRNRLDFSKITKTPNPITASSCT